MIFHRFLSAAAAVILASAATVNGQETETAAADFTSSTADYEVTVESISLTDSATDIGDIASIHNGRSFDVVAALNWADHVYDSDSTNVLFWEMFVDGSIKDSGKVDLNADRELPTTLPAGSAQVDNSGTHTVEVKIALDTTSDSSQRDYQSFNPGASFVPLVMVILFSVFTKMVELSLGIGIFVGACMVAGTLTGGFRSTLDVYILDAVANVDHAYVFLFILFMAGLVGLIEKSGGLLGITRALKHCVKSSRSAQAASFVSGLIIFFDDYANTLVAGASMRSLMDACVVSREKLAFIVDATAAPIASLVPISSWIGYEVSLIQAELDKILASDPNASIAQTGMGVFLKTIQYRYYCIFMLFFIPMIIASGRDFGPMLIAERLTKVYGRTDGGPGAAVSADGEAVKTHNPPKKDTPQRWWNMAVPILALIAYIFYFLVYTGKQGGGDDMTFVEIMENSNSYQALLWGTMAAALTAFAFYIIQDKKEGRIIFFNVKGYMNRLKRAVNKTAAVDGEEHATILMGYKEAMAAFLIGMEKIFSALVILTLAWATGAIMQAVGLNRFFGEILTNNVDPTMLPTLTFVISIFIAFATGTSWGTMSILFPLVLGPSYQASGGNPVIFYGVVAGILAGAVAGDHASPISDTTVLSSMACECELLSHVKTQAPYALMVSVWSILVGTIPSGRGLANWICILLGFIFMLFHAVLTSESAINKTGRFDIFTELYICCSRKNRGFYEKLKEDTVIAFETGEAVPLSKAAVKKLANEDSLISATQLQKTSKLSDLDISESTSEEDRWADTTTSDEEIGELSIVAEHPTDTESPV